MVVGGGVVLASGGSQRERGCGLWEETGGGSDGAQRQQGRAGEAGASKAGGRAASKQSGVPRRRKAASRGERTSNARQTA